MRCLVEKNHYEIGNVFDDLKDTVGPEATKALDFLNEQARKIPEEAQDSFEEAVKRSPVQMMAFAAAGGAIGGQVLKSWAGVIALGAFGLWLGSTVLDPRPKKRFDPSIPPKKQKTPSAPPDRTGTEVTKKLREALKDAQMPR